MTIEEMDFEGEIKWLRMGNGSFRVDPIFRNEFKIVRHLNSFIEANKNDNKLIETFEELVRDKNTFAQQLRCHQVSRIG